MRRAVPLLLALLLSAPLAHAGPKQPKQPKPLLLQPLVDEMQPGETPLTKAQDLAVRRSEACLKQDGNWLRAQENQVPVNQLYELLSSAVVCWQGAEKKAAAGGEEAAAVARWTAGRTRYMEAFRSWIWAIDAKISNDQRHICQRLTTASQEGAAAIQAADGLSGFYEGAAARALAMQLAADSKSLAEAVGGEFKNQRCGD
jgi:hypothetical protein